MIHWAVLCFFFFCMFLLFPGLVCLLHGRGKISFGNRRGRLLFIVLYSLLSWCFVNAALWLPAVLLFTGVEGPEAAFALFAGWLYLWIASVPVFLIYGVIRAVRRFMGR